MAVIFKKTFRVNPIKPDAPGKYYPHLITMQKSVDEEHIIYQIKELSSLSKGDIQSVVTNLFDVVRTNLYSGHSVNIRNFGVFTLSAKTEGAETEKECTAKNIKAVRINFRASSSVRPDVNSTRAGEKITFIDFDTYIKNMGLKQDTNSGDDSGNPGGGNDWEDPTA